jgi:adenylate cyclase
MAAPLIALGASWAGGTTVRAVQERREKAAVRRQFAARVSGQLVEYLEENPNLINMEGEERELTMLFTDFAGFTAISERLEGPQTVAILNRFLRAITDVLLEHDAYVNKFMGDGAMAFWGAPMASDRHATDACLATVDCFAELDRQNVSPEHGDLPPIGMRAGIATGRVIVGDCGAPPRLNDYTVIGDAVNLAARLESANKQMGTRALVTRRTYDMIAPEARDRILWRPLGQLRVVGQATPNEILEMVCRKDAGWCDDSVRDWVKRTEDAVAAFAAGEIERAMGLWQDLVVAERGSSGALLYVERCAELLESGAEDWVLPLRSK